MAWVALVLAGMFEVVGVLAMNRLKQKKDKLSVLLLVLGFIVSFALLSVAMKTISMGTAYAVWTAIGTVGGTLVGMLLYGESRQPLRIFFLALVVAAVVGLKALGNE
ncbi:QacE family quaternary ammonium compound efflux SMR transporter [Cohnella sp. CIP 111063]|uniref:DMT family transporter n=1 Tax=unclassified Cohnella TaxID=2636738 RepID=UPI000B8BD6AB|nr:MULTISPECIES: multidrug efflux SMR transporter [unclassified Cohnella]OXS55834.1 QacE family quaternary ammonium compound efflux SMR transporter [Cohnella sp. CIP 111063]PRX67032.1 paired small multidrug resistance pump [Cohnella sp. SGD-V74]